MPVVFGRAARAALSLFLSITCGLAGDDRPDFQASNMELVGHVPTGTLAADVWVHNRHAYVGSRACGEGVSIIDVREPENGRLLGRVPADGASTYEDVVVLAVNTPAFTGDLLATGVQPCSARGTQRGVHLWDVSDPANPVELAFFETGKRGSVHELSARQVGERVYLYLAVPYSERYGEGGDFRIVDATDPRQPWQVSDWGVYSRLGLNDGDLRVLSRPVVYCHSAAVSDDGRYAYLSYWDAGYITLNIEDPANPVFVSRVEYQGDEGNAHSVFPVTSRNLLLAADEDYLIGGARVDVTAPESSTPAVTELPFAKPACTVEPREMEVVFAGQGCGGALLPDVTDRIVAFDAGGCSYYEKALAAQRAGAAGFFLARTANARLDGGNEAITIPGVILSPEDFTRLRNSGQIVRAQIGPGADRTWGYLRIFDIADLGAPRQVGSFATENAARCPPPGGGWYSIHNPVVVGDVAYLSWYSDGVRAVDISDPAKPVEIGSFVIRLHAHDSVKEERERSAEKGGAEEHIEHEHAAGELETFVWGVVVQDGLVYLSDEKTGLWIVRLKPAGEGRG